MILAVLCTTAVTVYTRPEASVLTRPVVTTDGAVVIVFPFASVVVMSTPEVNWVVLSAGTIKEGWAEGPVVESAGGATVVEGLGTGLLELGSAEEGAAEGDGLGPGLMLEGCGGVLELTGGAWLELELGGGSSEDELELGGGCDGSGVVEGSGGAEVGGVDVGAGDGDGCDGSTTDCDGVSTPVFETGISDEGVSEADMVTKRKRAEGGR